MDRDRIFFEILAKLERPDGFFGLAYLPHECGVEIPQTAQSLTEIFSQFCSTCYVLYI
jgi:hypothetical protein